MGLNRVAAAALGWPRSLHLPAQTAKSFNTRLRKVCKISVIKSFGIQVTEIGIKLLN